SLNDRSTQPVGWLVIESSASRCCLGNVSPGHIHRGHLQSIRHELFILCTLRSTAVFLLHLTDPTIDVRRGRTALARSEVIKDKRRILRITGSLRQFVL